MSPCVLFIVDGLRPEALTAAPMPTVTGLVERGAFSVTARSVMPCCTLPCHFSIFHSVPPERHGITSNTWTPMVRPLPGIFEVLKMAGKRSAFAYNWEELRDLGRPGTLTASRYIHCVPGSDDVVADQAAEYVGDGHDFVFCYLGLTDEIGHRHGWLSPEYLQTAANADACIARVLAALPEDGSAIITADHGGHDRTHGIDCPEDMTVPLAIWAPGREFASDGAPISLLDIAPTVARLCGVTAPEAWEGRSLVR